RAAVAKTNECAALLPHLPDSEPLPTPIMPAPRGERREQAGQRHAADSLQGLQPQLLRGGKLGVRRQTLPRNAPAHANLRATRRGSLWRGGEQRFQPGLVIIALAPRGPVQHLLAGQCIGDEYGLAIDMGHTGSVAGQIVDARDIARRWLATAAFAAHASTSRRAGRISRTRR